MRIAKTPAIIKVVLVFLAMFVMVWSLLKIAFSPVEIPAVIVPHHDLVKAQRETFLSRLSARAKAPETVILVSPNHYESGRAHMQLSSKTWNLSNGSIKPNLSMITKARTAGVQYEPGSFDNEHGIKLILPDIKRYFPKAQVIPIIFKRATTLAELTRLNKALQSCHNCLLLASVDFSHYQPTQLANLHDDLTIRALDNNDTTTLMGAAETDSPPALGFVSLWVKARNTLRFNLFGHTNSGSILNQPNAETTSHLFGWYGKGIPIKPPTAVSFMVGGDMMFGRGIDHAFPGTKLPLVLDRLGERVFWGTDAALINLEGPISLLPVLDNNDPNNLNFNFSPQTVNALNFLHLNAAGNANNHSLNAGSAGLQDTRNLLTQAHIQAVGGPTQDSIKLMGSFKGQNATLKIIGINLINEPVDPTALIRSLKTNPQNRVLMFAHWGSEYAAKHDSAQAQAAHAWIDAGADIVIGSHPHVVQDGEVYKGRPIIYSLGNLLFDQNDRESAQQGMIVVGQFSTNQLRLFALPTQSINLKPQIAAVPIRQTLANQFYSNFGASLVATKSGKELKFDLK